MRNYAFSKANLERILAQENSLLFLAQEMGWLSYCIAICEEKIPSPFINKFFPNVFLAAYSLHPNREYQVKKVILHVFIAWYSIGEIHSGIAPAILRDFF